MLSVFSSVGQLLQFLFIFTTFTMKTRTFCHRYSIQITDQLPVQIHFTTNLNYKPDRPGSGAKGRVSERVVEGESVIENFFIISPGCTEVNG